MKILEKLSEYNKHIAKNIGGHYVRTYIDVVFCYIIYGASLADYFMFRFYDLSWRKRNTFITKRRVLKLWRVRSNEGARILTNKVRFMNVFKDFTGREFCDTTRESYDSFHAFCKKHGKVFIKPLFATEGLMAQAFEYKDDEDIKEKWEEVKRYPDDGALVEAYVRQHPAMMSLNPSSVNTIRVITYFAHNEVHFICATLRIGCGDSVTDNYSGSGLIAGVDLDTGVVTTKCHRHDEDFIYHPATHEKVVGFEIPHWDKVIQMCRNAALKLQDAPFIGWDVAIQEDGPILIEGNAHSGYHIMQEADGIGKWKMINGIKKD